MNPGLRQRISKLDARISHAPITLVFADGARQFLNGSVRHWQSLNQCLFERDGGLPAGAVPANSTLAAELESLERAVTIEGVNAEAYALTRAPCSSVEVDEDLGL